MLNVHRHGTLSLHWYKLSRICGAPMHIDSFIWLPHILDKIAIKHHVTQDEAEQVFFIHKQGNMALILSGRDMDRKERRRYERS